MSEPAAASARLRPDAARLPGRAALGALALVAIVYFAAFNHDFSVNGLRYAGDVERGVDLFHPNHLLPNALFRIAYLAVQLFANVRAIWVMQAINAVAGAVAAAALAAIAARRAGATTALLIAALYAFGFAAWNFAEEPDVYALPAAAVALSLALLDAREAVDWPRLLALGALAVFAVLTLQQYVFWYPALLALVARRELGVDRTRKLATLALGVPAACLGAYLLVGAAQGRLQDGDGALGWFLGYAWTPHGLATYRAAPALAGRLLGTLLGLGNLVFAYEVVLWPWALALAVAALFPLLWLVTRTAASLWRTPPATRSPALIVALWGLVNLAFAAWWESRNIEFLFPLWLAAVVLFALAAPALHRPALALAVVAVAGVNGAVAFVPQREWPARYGVAAELARREQLHGGDVLITEELNTVSYLQYFHGIDVRFQPGAVSAAMQASVPVAQARQALETALQTGARVYTTELDDHGRLYALARWFAPLGRRGFDGDVERDIAELYRGYDTTLVPVRGARRVRPATVLAH